MKNDQYHFSVIYMDILERKTYLCMDVTCRKILKKQEFSPFYLESFAPSLTLMIQDLEIKNLKKQLQE